MVSPTESRGVCANRRDVEGAVPYLTPWGCPPVLPLTREQDNTIDLENVSDVFSSPQDSAEMSLTFFPSDAILVL